MNRDSTPLPPEHAQPGAVGAAEKLLQDFFSALRTFECCYLVLRNHEGLPRHIGNDVDMLVDADRRPAAEHILVTVARAHGYALINRVEFSPVSLFFAHGDTRQQLHFDLFTDLQWRGFDILRPRAVLAARQDRGLFFTAHPVHESSLNLLTRLLFHGYVKTEYKPGILRAYTAEPGVARGTLAQPFGGRAAREIVERVIAGDWASIEASKARWRLLLLSRQSVRFPLRTLSAVLADARRLLRRFVAPPGLMLVTLGPDGCGKSSVAARLMDRLAATFARDTSKYFHWKPTVFRRRRMTGPVRDPHGMPPRSRLASVAYFSGHWLEFVLGSQLRLRWVLFRNGLVVVDRYFHDFFVDPKRYRLEVSQRLLTWASRLVMEPDLVVCLDAPPDVLRHRKEEVSIEETARQRQAYLDLAGTLPNAHVVDASRPLDEVVSDVEGIVLDYLAERTAQRLGRSNA